MSDQATLFDAPEASEPTANDVVTLTLQEAEKLLWGLAGGVYDYDEGDQDRAALRMGSEACGKLHEVRKWIRDHGRTFTAAEFAELADLVEAAGNEEDEDDE